MEPNSNTTSTLTNKDYLGTDIVNPLLTDFYQFSMIYAHWKNGRHRDNSIFDMYFRKCPFGTKVIYIQI
jgi:nicotinic acid phosphoribosyltransferase